MINRKGTQNASVFIRSYFTETWLTGCCLHEMVWVCVWVPALRSSEEVGTGWVIISGCAGSGLSGKYLYFMPSVAF